MPLNPHLLSSYSYPLDESRIAQYPAEPADTSKLLVRNANGDISDRVFHELPSMLDDTRVMFFNDSKVIPSRLVLRSARLTNRAGKEKIFDGEIFFLDDLGEGKCKCMVYPGDLFPVGGVVEYEGIRFLVEEVVYEGRILRIVEDMSQDYSDSAALTPDPSPKGRGETKTIWDVLETYGQLPLPPYIEYDPSKESWYQTIFAEKLWSLAAPTASLHFTPRVLESLENHGVQSHTVTLHVGLGTFKNIYTPDIRDYEMHRERIEVGMDIFSLIARYRNDGKTILAVGTTVARTLESLPYLWKLTRDDLDRDAITDEFWDRIARSITDTSIVSDISVHSGSIRFSSKIFIYPWFEWRVVDELITNFHLPQSTLLMLVSSFLGLEETLGIYEYALKKDYRLFSFGDAMYLRERIRSIL